jgi:hypothetical protein
VRSRRRSGSPNNMYRFILRRKRNVPSGRLSDSECHYELSRGFLGIAVDVLRLVGHQRLRRRTASSCDP